MSLGYIGVVLLAAFIGLMLLLWRRTFLLSQFFLGLAIAGFIFAIGYHAVCELGYSVVKVGDSERRVWLLLGHPWEVSDGTRGPYGWPRGKDEMPNSPVTKEYWYYCIYLPQMWVVSFDAAGHVITKGKIVSP